MARLKELYEEEIIQELKKEFDYSNVMAVPRLEKILVNMGLGEAKDNYTVLENGMEELALITGQKPKISRAKKSIASFEIRQGDPVGCFVTLRGDRMYEFIDRVMTIVLPRVRDFQGVPTKSFDGRGNYTLGLEDQLVFPEIDYSEVDHIKGMNITINTTTERDEEAKFLLDKLGMPFEKKR